MRDSKTERSRLSPCIDTLFLSEEPAREARIALCAEAGFSSFEFWHCTDDDMAGLERAIVATGLRPLCFAMAPNADIGDPANHDAFIASLEKSVTIAERLGAKFLITQSGIVQAGVSRVEQIEHLISALGNVSEMLHGTKITLLLEPLNIVGDPDTLITSTGAALDVIDAVGSKQVRLLFDLYHALTNGEMPVTVLDGRLDRIAHVHLAESPGRHQPGTGHHQTAAFVHWMLEQGYQGDFGLEFYPTGSTYSALAETRALLEGL